MSLLLQWTGLDSVSRISLFVITWLFIHSGSSVLNVVMAQDPGMVTDSTSLILSGNPKGAQVALVAPRLDFGLVQIDPNKYDDDHGHWGNVVRGPDGKYYAAYGNHSIMDNGTGSSILVAWDPVTGHMEHVWDWERQLLYGTTAEGALLVYDTENREVVFSTNPKIKMALHLIGTAGHASLTGKLPAGCTVHRTEHINLSGMIPKPMPFTGVTRMT